MREEQHAGAHQDTPVEASATMTPRVASMAHLQTHSIVCKHQSLLANSWQSFTNT